MHNSNRFAFSPVSIFQFILLVIFTLSINTAYAGLNVSVEPNTRGILSTLMDCNIVLSFGSDVEIDLNKILVKLNGEDVTEDIRSMGTTSLDESKKNLTITYPAHASYFRQGDYTFEVSTVGGVSDTAVLKVQEYDEKAVCINCDSSSRSISGVALNDVVEEQTRAVKSKDKQKPKVTSFKVKPEKISLGQSVDISYSVSDAGGLKQVELWRSSNNKDWKEKDKKKLSGKKQASGTFTDKPDKVGNWYYGVHVVDNAGNWDSEGGAKKVTVESVKDKTKPVINKLTLSKPSIKIGEEIEISYTVSDAGGSGLRQVELWKGKAKGNLSHYKTDKVSGNGPVPGKFKDTPKATGTYYYGIHVLDHKDNLAYDNGALPVVVVENIKSAGSVLDSSYMGKPLSQGYKVKNKYFNNWWHTGFDIGTSNSNPNVYAIADGDVVCDNTSISRYKTNYSKYWNGFLIIKHGNYYAYYGHLNSSVSVRKHIYKGDIVGTIRNAYKCNENLTKIADVQECGSKDDKSVLNKVNNHLHISISTGEDWIKGNWGYQSTESDVEKLFVNPTSYIGM